MQPLTCYACSRDDAESIPPELIEELGLSFYAAHTEASAMARVAIRRMQLAGDVVCRVPFCVTVEAEALGARIKVPDDEGGPRCSEYRFQRMEELSGLQPMDLTRGRIATVLDSLPLLHGQGGVATLNVEGPFTILSFLIDSATLFRGLISHRPILEQALALIEASLVRYIREGIRRGAGIISYADPTGALEIFGPKLYREVVGASTYRILRELEKDSDRALIHLCGQKSRSLEKVGLCTAQSVPAPAGMTYGDSLCHFVQAKTPAFLGHNCMKSSNLALNRPTLWQIRLKEERS
ncbi:MAG: uroporphyrinogen decarboxylase family protein [Desulfobulbus sp.]